MQISWSVMCMFNAVNSINTQLAFPQTSSIYHSSFVILSSFIMIWRCCIYIKHCDISCDDIFMFHYAFFRIANTINALTEKNKKRKNRHQMLIHVIIHQVSLKKPLNILKHYFFDSLQKIEYK